MHEVSIATELHRACRVEVDARGGGRLDAVAVTIGELSAVEPALLRYAWEAVLAGTGDAGATLEVTWTMALQRCPMCGPVLERQPGSWMRLCPECDAPLLIEGGRELDIARLQFTPMTDHATASGSARCAGAVAQEVTS